MKNKFDNILLCILWLLVSILTTCFWFNIRFGFDILTRSHWQHLAYMQASKIPINISFYISLIIATFTTILGFYIIIRPNFKKIRIKTTSDIEQQSNKPTKNTSQPQTAPMIPENNISRPPRLTNSPQQIQTAQFIPTAPVVTSPQAPFATQMPPQTEKSDNQEIREIFESMGYVVKKAPRIKDLQTALFAIGTNETIWIGAENVKTSKMEQSIQILEQIFSDTLDDIEIAVNGFVINAPDYTNPESPEILTFDSIDSLRNYMKDYENPQPEESDVENFEAFSSYINTVLDYIGKI